MQNQVPEPVSVAVVPEETVQLAQPVPEGWKGSQCCSPPPKANTSTPDSKEPLAKKQTNQPNENKETLHKNKVMFITTVAQEINQRGGRDNSWLQH